MGLASDQKFTDHILGKMFEIYFESTRRMLDEVGDILDVWVYWDDLSGQNGPLINPKWYEKNLMPLHRKLFDLCQIEDTSKNFLPLLRCSTTLDPLFYRCGCGYPQSGSNFR